MTALLPPSFFFPLQGQCSTFLTFIKLRNVRLRKRVTCNDHVGHTKPLAFAWHAVVAFLNPWWGPLTSTWTSDQRHRIRIFWTVKDDAKGCEVFCRFLYTCVARFLKSDLEVVCKLCLCYDKSVSKAFSFSFFVVVASRLLQVSKTNRFLL